jgi:integrase/recombinase XerD
VFGQTVALMSSDATACRKPTVAAQVSLAQADNDETLTRLWLHGRPATTAAAYSRDAGALLAHVAKPLRAVTLGDLQDYASSLSGLAPASQARKIAACKSLIAFAHKLGYLPFDTARPLHTPRLKDTLAERIITEAEAQRLIALEPNPRNQALLRLLYSCGLRISEACGLCWRDLKGAKSGGQATVFGKGGKTRAVLIQAKLWRLLQALKRDAGPDDPVFRGQRGGLDRSGAHRICKAAGKRAGLDPRLSAHWLRHASASHALDNGAPVHVVQQSLGHASLATTTRYSHARPSESVSQYIQE